MIFIVLSALSFELPLQLLHLQEKYKSVSETTVVAIYLLNIFALFLVPNI